jgi:hypothetical protein
VTDQNAQPDSTTPAQERPGRAFPLPRSPGDASRRGLLGAAVASVVVVGGGGGLLEAFSSGSKLGAVSSGSKLEAFTSGSKGASGVSASAASAATAGTAVGPSGDTTGAKDTAAINAVAGAGGAVMLTSGTYYITHLLPGSYGAIIGTGPNSVLQAVSGITGYAIALKTPASTQQVYLADFTLNAHVPGLGGILLDNTGFGTDGDPQHTLENVYIQQADGDAFHFGANSRSMRITNCRQYGAGGSGFWLEVGCTDNSFTGCISATSALHGFNVFGWNNYFTSCKSFYAGSSGSVFDKTHCCFEIGLNAAYNTFAACSAQNAALHGWDLQNCVNNAIVGCEADGNSMGSGTVGAGVNLNGATACTIIGMVGAAQVYGVQVAGTLTDTCLIANTVTGTTAAFNYVSGGGYFLVGPNEADFSGIPGGVQFGNIDVKVAGAGLQVKEGANCKQGTAVLVRGTVTMADTAATATSRIFLTSQADGGTPGFLRVSARTPGTSFTITSSSGTDTSVVAYEIFEPG